MSDRDPLAGLIPFVAVGRALSFGRAADELGVSTAAVSKAVSKLEEELGVRLVHRTSRHVSLTLEGEQFFRQCAAALSNLDEARRTVQAKRARVHGELTVSLPFILGRVLVPRLGELTAQHPELAVRLILTDRFVKLAEEKVDVAIRIGEAEDGTLVSRKLMRPRWVTVASPAYIQARGAPKTPADLGGHNCLRFVTPRGGTRDFTFAERGPARAEVTSGDSASRGAATTTPVRGNLRLDDGELLIEAAVAGQGLCQVFDFAVARELETGRLVEVLAAYSAPGPVVRWLCPEGRHKLAPVRAFLDFAQRCLTG